MVEAMEATLGEGAAVSGALSSGTEYTSEGPSEYGTRKGSCHTLSGEEGHYSFECNVMKLGATSAQSEPSAYGKGN
jgi:hypothetical protein